MKKQPKNAFEDLTWADLEAWAGAKIVSRGTDYQKSGYVKNLAVTHDGSLLAWVLGSANYATSVSIEKGRLSSVCTCPFDGNCKHAVAVVLEYLDRVKKKVNIPPADEGDERFVLLEDESFAAYDDDDDAGDEDDDDQFSLDDKLPAAGSGVDSFLRKKSKKELETMLAGVIEDYPEIKKKLGFTPPPRKKKGCDALVKAVTKAIVLTSKEQGWRNYWKHTGHTPDYEPVRKGLLQLLEEGCADDVVRLGEKLFVKGTAQVEQSHDEGETADEIAETMPLVFKALAKSSLPDMDKLEHAVDFGLRDEYGLCRGLDEFMKRSFGKKTWSDLADRLLERLKNMKSDGREGAFFRNYRRDRLSDEVVRALENGGRKDEAIAVCLQEAETTGSYERLVKKLRKADRTTEAEEWIRKGVKATRDKLPGIASTLKTTLREIRQKKKDWPVVAALRAEDFFEGPNLQTYGDLQRSSERVKVWHEVRDACLKFLETGDLPVGKADWPLPDTGFEKTEKAGRGKPPFTDILIDIAIKERRVDDVIRWYDFHKQRTKWPETHLDDEVATAVAHAYPNRAIAIWKKLAEELIARTNVGAYGEAVTYLGKTRKALDSVGKAADWAVYLANLTETNKRKSRLVQMLNTLSGKPILLK
jgi:uncharacterized Zn finger protein